MGLVPRKGLIFPQVNSEGRLVAARAASSRSVRRTTEGDFPTPPSMG